MMTEDFIPLLRWFAKLQAIRDGISEIPMSMVLRTYTVAEIALNQTSWALGFPMYCITDWQRLAWEMQRELAVVEIDRREGNSK